MSAANRRTNNYNLLSTCNVPEPSKDYPYCNHLNKKILPQKTGEELAKGQSWDFKADADDT